MDSRNGGQVPRPCANGCGFFGNPSTNDLCSDCHRERCQNALLAKIMDAAAEAKQTREETPAAASTSSAPSASAPPPERCGRCSKKLRLCSRYGCRCGAAFCAAHRLPETHACSYDFKTAGRAAIAKANPLVVGRKLERLSRGGD